MKRFTSYLLLLWLDVALWTVAPTRAAARELDLESKAPGVAFSLRPDYATIAVRSSSQSPVAVARVQGTEAYKSLMRMGVTQPSTRAVEYSTWCPLYYAWTPQSVQDYLGYCRGDPDVDAMRDVLEKLKVAAEAHLGHAICLVNMSLLDRAAAKGRLEQIIDTAMANLCLMQAISVKPDAATWALYNEGWLDRPYESGLDLMFLTIESDSTGTINLDLALMEEGVLEPIQRHHNVTRTTLPAHCQGEETLSAICKEVASQRRVAIRETLKTFTTPPFDDWDRETPPSVSKITVHGDAAHDAVLHEELRALFDPFLSDNTIAKQPTYSSALGGATHASRRINEPWYDGEPPFWCCLRSWGKACPSTSQRIDI